jgi:hypothetical protein
MSQKTTRLIIHALGIDIGGHVSLDRNLISA